MRVFVACLLAVSIVAGGAYAVLRSVERPTAVGTYSAQTTGSASGVDWSDRFNAGFDQ